jgi:rare lipoprotein A
LKNKASIGIIKENLKKVNAMLLNACILLTLACIFNSCAPAPRFTSKTDAARPSFSQSDTNISETAANFSNPGDVLETYKGTASYYADEFHGNLTANGEIYNMHGLSAAHTTFPFGTKIRVVNLDNGKSVNVIVNDRMPYNPERIIDLSLGAAKKLDMIEPGLAEVRLEILEWGESEEASQN